jgi:hypothetical protein
MPKSTELHTVREHFETCSPAIAQIYAKLLAAAKKLGPVREEAKKTSIHLAREVAFAGVATRKEALILTLKSDHDLAHPRVGKRERTSANRWHVEIRLTKPAEVDRELVGWLKKAYELAG